MSDKMSINYFQLNRLTLMIKNILLFFTCLFKINIILHCYINNSVNQITIKNNLYKTLRYEY